MQQPLSLFAGHLGVGIAEDEPDGCEEVTLAGAIASDDNVCAGGEGLNDRLVLVAVGKSARAWSRL